MLARTLGIVLGVTIIAGAASAQAQTTDDTAWILAPMAGASQASDVSKAPPKLGVTAQGQLGVVLARGNTNTSTANAKLEVVRTTRAAKDDFEIEGLYGKTGDIVTAERWAAAYQRDWNLSERTFWFAGLQYERDLFSGFAYQASGATGVGYRIIDTDSTKFQAQVGAGYRRLRPEELTIADTGEVIARTEGDSQGELVGNGKLNFEHSFNPQAKVTDTVMTVFGSSNTFLENDLALLVKLNGALSVSIGYTLRNNSNPPPGLLHTDTLTTVNLVYQKK